MKKQELIEKLKRTNADFTNVFIPVSEVIEMVNSLEDEGFVDIESMATHIAQEIEQGLERSGTGIIDSFDIDADTRGNSIEVSLSDVSFDSYEIESIVQDSVENVIKEIVAKSREEKSEVYN